MKTVISLLLLFSMNSFSCELSEKIVSLSGPITLLLEELDLLKDKNLLAISKFHPVEKKFNGQILAGGIFLSKKSLNAFKNVKMFFDKSREFKSLLKKSGVKKYIEIDTRDQDPFEAFNLSLVKIMNSLKGCHKTFEALEAKVSIIKSKLKLNPNFERSIFYLGHIKNKYPEIVIANDGFVLGLKAFEKFKTYPSDLSYVTWSKKIMNKLKDFNRYGVSEGKCNDINVLKVSDSNFNLSMRGVLTPGIRQVYFLERLQNLSLH